MKILGIALILCAASSFAMQQQSSDFTLDEKGIEEFRSARKRLTELGANVENAQTNKLLANFKSLAQKDDNQLRALFAQDAIQSTIKEFHTTVTNNPDYKKSYAEAVAGNDAAKWDSWRKTNDKLMMPLIAAKGIKLAFPSAALIEANSNATDEALNCFTASSFLLYYARQEQRKITKSDPPAIQID